jgi:hypothetical protein
MDECTASLRDARTFSKLNYNSVYWQIPVYPGDRAQTIFASHEGLYWFRRLLFGLWNVQATLLWFVDITSAGFTWKSCLVFLNTTLCFPWPSTHCFNRESFPGKNPPCSKFEATSLALSHDGIVTMLDNNSHCLCLGFRLAS